MTAKSAADRRGLPAQRFADDAHSARLVRGLGLTDCVLLVVGSMVGSGIFLTTGQIAGALPSAWLILLAWLLGGAMALSGALTYAEMGAAFPRAGGHYVYLREAYGPLVGFFDGWLSFAASFPGSIAFVALAMVAYLPASWGEQSLFTVTALDLTWGVHSAQLIAIGVILGLSLVNGLGLRAASGTQNFLTTLKIAALVGIAASALLSGGGRWSNLLSTAIPGSTSDSLRAMGIALIGVSFAYLGWDASTYMAAEMRGPQRNLPRSLALGTLLVLVLYLAFSVGLLYGVPVTHMPASENVTRDAVSALLGTRFTGLVGAAILLCILGSLNAAVMVGPRIYYAMARDALFPAAFARVHHATRVPAVAIAAQALWSCVIILSVTLGRILAFTVLVIWVLSAITGAAVFVLRRRQPELARPYRTWGYPWLPAFFVLSSTALAANHLAHTPGDLLWLFAFLLAGLPLYAILRRSRIASQDTTQPISDVLRR